MSDFWWKRLRQNGHANGRMSPWINRCVVSVDDLLNCFSHTPHLNCLGETAVATAVVPPSVPALFLNLICQIHVAASTGGWPRAPSSRTLLLADFSERALRSSPSLSVFLSTVSKNGFQIFAVDWSRSRTKQDVTAVELSCCIFNFFSKQRLKCRLHELLTRTNPLYSGKRASPVLRCK